MLSKSNRISRVNYYFITDQNSPQTGFFVVHKQKHSTCMHDFMMHFNIDYLDVKFQLKFDHLNCTCEILFNPP